MKENCDVLVAGAGPAGSRTARDLARQGFEVTLVEDHKQPGRPCHCSGLVTPRTLAVADAGPGLILNSIRGATVYSPDGNALQLTGNSERAVVVDRVELDRRLAGQAVRAGARLRTGSRFVEFRTDGSTSAKGGWVQVLLEEDSGPVQISARLLVGADGAQSRVARQLRGGSQPAGLVRAFGGDAHYSGNDLLDHVQIFFDQRAAPGWFGWTIPLSSGLARVGTGTTNGVRPLQSMSMLRRSFPQHFEGSTFLARRAGCIPLWEPAPMVSDRVMLVGDAARQVKPASGGGILTALLSAELAATEGAGALREGNFSKERLSRYSKMWERHVGSELKRQHDMRRALNRLDQWKLQDVLKALSTGRLKSSLETSGDIDFPSGLLWSLAMHHPSLLLRLAVMPRFPSAWLTPRSRRLLYR